MNKGRAMRTILYVSGTRADYGLMRTTLAAIHRSRKLRLIVLATGMHTMKRYGMTVDEIRKDHLPVHTVPLSYPADGYSSMSLFMGEFIKKLTSAVSSLKPDLILVLGDRPEMLAAATVGMYLHIPVAHLHGGEVTSTVDEFARHAITKLSHLHLPATRKSGQRIRNMGEEDWRIHVVGAPGLDQILHAPLLSRQETFRKLGLITSLKTALVLYHPVLSSTSSPGKEMIAVLEAVREQGFQAAVIYPNADPGSKEVIFSIEQFRANPHAHVHTFRNIDHGLFLSLMKHADVMVGNSSSALIEAPSFRLAAVNVGERQSRRERAANVIDVPARKKDIRQALKKAVSQPFKRKMRTLTNPYGDGKTAGRIVKILASLHLDDKLLQKQLTY